MTSNFVEMLRQCLYAIVQERAVIVARALERGPAAMAVQPPDVDRLLLRVITAWEASLASDGRVPDIQSSKADAAIARATIVQIAGWPIDEMVGAFAWELALNPLLIGASPQALADLPGPSRSVRQTFERKRQGRKTG